MRRVFLAGSFLVLVAALVLLVISFGKIEALMRTWSDPSRATSARFDEKENVALKLPASPDAMDAFNNDPLIPGESTEDRIRRILGDTPTSKAQGVFIGRGK